LEQVDDTPLTEFPTPPKPPAGFTLGDQAHAVAELAYEIAKRFKGFTTTDGLRAVEIAFNDHHHRQALRMTQAVDDTITQE
jgi:hypothetical protein